MPDDRIKELIVAIEAMERSAAEAMTVQEYDDLHDAIVQAKSQLLYLTSERNRSLEGAAT